MKKDEIIFLLVIVAFFLQVYIYWRKTEKDESYDEKSIATVIKALEAKK